MRAVILAGGRGTRLAPYTTVLPKPLMPVGDFPILEIVLRRLQEAGIARATLAVGHLSALIQAYFGDGARWGIDIDYSYEHEPLGTAGPLSMVQGLEEPFLVMNGDLLTDLAFEDLASAHRASGAVATIGTFARQIKLELGVVEVDDVTVIGYTEKPLFDFVVSMGIYVFNPSVLELIGDGERLDLPDLIARLLERGAPVAAHLHDGYWLDIGRPDDYERAQQDAPALLARLLPNR